MCAAAPGISPMAQSELRTNWLPVMSTLRDPCIAFIPMKQFATTLWATVTRSQCRSIPCAAFWM